MFKEQPLCICIPKELNVVNVPQFIEYVNRLRLDGAEDKTIAEKLVQEYCPVEEKNLNDRISHVLDLIQWKCCAITGK